MGRPRKPFDPERERRRRSWRESKARAKERLRHDSNVCIGENCPLTRLERAAVPLKNGQGYVYLPR